MRILSGQSIVSFCVFSVCFAFFACSSVCVFGQNAAVEDARIEKKGDFFVAKNGNDAWSGTLSFPNADGTDGPFATLEKARSAVRSAFSETPRPYCVIVRGGLYELMQTFTLDAQDSGRENARITWKAHPGETVRLSAGKYLNSWTKVTDPAILAQLPESVRGEIVQVDLKAAGVENYGSPKGGGIELFFNGEPMTLSRYPNADFVKIVSVDVNEEVNVRGTIGDKVGNFRFDDERILSWRADFTS